jgi:shikimate dehydrogenase
MSDQKKSIYGLIGYPLGHSLSPLMHNAAFEALNVEAVYKLFPFKEDDLGGFFAELRETTSPIFGLNVTIPYKEKVIPYLDSLSPYALKIQAVNTIVISEQRVLVGFNTDGPGFLTHLKELNFETEKKRIAIMGAGGVTRAILAVLCLLPERPASIRVYDREKNKAKILIEDLKVNNIDVSIAAAVGSIDELKIESADFLINATPIGMKADDPCLVDGDLIHTKMCVYDVIYNPAETKLLKLAKGKGARVSNGLGMLFYQGVLAFQHWLGMELEEEIKAKMKASLIKGLKA